jgi:hypothetical protein
MATTLGAVTAVTMSLLCVGVLYAAMLAYPLRSLCFLLRSDVHPVLRARQRVMGRFARIGKRLGHVLSQSCSGRVSKGSEK